MLTEFDYVVAWIIYLVCAAGLYWTLSRIIKWLKFPVLIYFFNSVLAVMLFTPAISVPDENLWAPAYVVAVYGYIQDEQLLATQAALYMLGAWCIVGFILILNYLFSVIKASKTDKNNNDEDAPRDLQDNPAQPET